MKLFITGATGLFGSKLAQIAISQGHQVYSADTQHPAPYGTPVKIDITDIAMVEAAFSQTKPDIVIHAAAITDVDKCELTATLPGKSTSKAPQTSQKQQKPTTPI